MKRDMYGRAIWITCIFWLLDWDNWRVRLQPLGAIKCAF